MIFPTIAIAIAISILVCGDLVIRIGFLVEGMSLFLDLCLY